MLQQLKPNSVDNIRPHLKWGSSSGKKLKSSPGCNQDGFWAQEVEMNFRNARKKRLRSTQKYVCRRRKGTSWTNIAYFCFKNFDRNMIDIRKIWQRSWNPSTFTVGRHQTNSSKSSCRKIVMSIHLYLSKMKDNKCLKDCSPCQA